VWIYSSQAADCYSNITIATFAEASLYKQEAAHPSLYAGAILDAHGLPVAYKSVSHAYLVLTLTWTNKN
jgi:hypothetical protein